MTATPATVARLFDGKQLVKRVHIENATKIIQTNDMPPPLLKELDDSFGEEHRVTPFSVWEHCAWAGTDYIDYEDWMVEFGPVSTPKTAMVPRKDKSPVVVVIYADYQRQGGRVG